MTAGGASTGCGTQTAALGFGIYANGVTQKYDGTSWTNTASLATARNGLGGAGTQASGLGAGGYVSPGNPNSNATEEFTGGGAPATKTVTST